MAGCVNLEVLWVPWPGGSGTSAGGSNPKEGLDIDRSLRDCAQRRLGVSERSWQVGGWGQSSKRRPFESGCSQAEVGEGSGWD